MHLLLPCLVTLATPSFSQEPTRGVEPVIPDVPEELLGIFGTSQELGIGSYRALMISAQAYGKGSGIKSLRNPTTDIEKVGAVLESQYGFDVEYLRNAEQAQIIDAFDRLVQDLEPEDALLVYFAGHGVLKEEEQRGYWLPVDATSSSTARWIDTDSVAAKMRAMPARHVLLIADSCFSGIMSRSVDSFVTEFDESSGLQEARKLASRRSRWVMTSGGNEPVADGGADGMSVFAYFLRETLRNAENRYILPDALFPTIRRAVAENAQQTPTQGKLLQGMQDDGQLVLINQASCGLLLEVRVRNARLESELAWERDVVRTAAGQNDATYLRAVETWIGNWAGYNVDACNETAPVELERMREAVRIRDRLLEEGTNPADSGSPPRRKRWGPPVAIGGAVMLAGGAAMVASSQLWWADNRSQFDVSSAGIRPTTDELGDQLRRRRLMGVLGGTLVGIGAVSLGSGTLGFVFSDGAVGIRWGRKL